MSLERANFSSVQRFLYPDIRNITDTSNPQSYGSRTFTIYDIDDVVIAEYATLVMGDTSSDVGSFAVGIKSGGTVVDERILGNDLAVQSGVWVTFSARATFTNLAPGQYNIGGTVWGSTGMQESNEVLDVRIERDSPVA